MSEASNSLKRGMPTGLERVPTKDVRYAPHYQMSFRVKPHVGEVLGALSERMGLTKTAILVMALRELAKKEGVCDPSVRAVRKATSE